MHARRIYFVTKKLLLEMEESEVRFVDPPVERAKVLDVLERLRKGESFEILRVS